MSKENEMSSTNADAETLAYRVLWMLWSRPREAFRVEEIAAGVLGRSLQGFDVQVARAAPLLEAPLALLVERGHVLAADTSEPIAVRYYRCSAAPSGGTRAEAELGLAIELASGVRDAAAVSPAETKAKWIKDSLVELGRR